MTYNPILNYQAAFGNPPDEELLNVFAGAAANGMSERMILVAIYHIQSENEKGCLKEVPEKAVAKYLRRLYRSGLR